MRPLRSSSSAARRSRLALPVALLAATLVLTLSLRIVTVRSDIAAFLPAGHTTAARVMLEQLRGGPATSLVLLGIEGAAPATSRASAASWRQPSAGPGSSPSWRMASRRWGADARFLFRRRYLLSPLTTPAAFTTDRLHADFGACSPASPPPPRRWSSGTASRTRPAPFPILPESGPAEARCAGRGVWFAPHRDRALILVRIRANGLDLVAEDRAIAAIQAASRRRRRRRVRAGAGRLLDSGPAVFAHDAARAIRRDVRLIAIVSTLLVMALVGMAVPLALRGRCHRGADLAQHQRRPARRAGRFSVSFTASPWASG